MFVAKWIVTHNFPTLCLVLLNLRESHNGGTKAALDSKTMDNFFDYTRSAPYFYIFVAHWTVLIKNQPVFNAQLAKQFVAIVTFLCISTHFCRLTISIVFHKITYWSIFNIEGNLWNSCQSRRLQYCLYHSPHHELQWWVAKKMTLIFVIKLVLNHISLKKFK